MSLLLLSSIHDITLFIYGINGRTVRINDGVDATLHMGNLLILLMHIYRCFLRNEHIYYYYIWIVGKHNIIDNECIQYSWMLLEFLRIQSFQKGS